MPKQSSMFDQDGYLLEKYRLQVTTWSHCWRCGESIPLNHSNEIRSGIHQKCDFYHEIRDSRNQDKLRLELYIRGV